jgi:hypothetical protein
MHLPLPTHHKTLRHFQHNDRITMASLSYLARTVARRSFQKVACLSSTSQLGAVRFSTTYFTPGMS